MPSDPLLAAVFVWLAAHGLAACAWPTLRLPRLARALVLAPLAVACFCAPLVVGRDPWGPFVFLAVTCPVLLLKLIDLHVGAGWWRTQSFSLWLRHLPLPLVLVVRRHLEQPVRPRRASLRLLARGVLKVGAGLVLLRLANAWELGLQSFWLDHFVRALGWFFIAFDGAMDVACATLRLLGIHVMDFSRNPIVSRTPAEFWRRYNRPGGRFLYENVFVPSGGASAPLRGTLLVFLVNGLLHEALAWILVGRFQGYQLAFFAVHAVVVGFTFRLRPRRPAAVLAGHVLTFLFVLASTVFFFASIDAMGPGAIYPHGGLLP